MSDAEEFPDVFRGAREYVLSALPESVRDLHAAIEVFAGVPVDFRPASMLRAAGITKNVYDASYCDEGRAYVMVDDANGIVPGAVTHELLHIHRYWVEMAPQLDAVTDAGGNVEFMTWVDNALEHLIIVPRERDHGFDPTPHWSRAMLNLFAPHGPATLSAQYRSAYMMGWAMTAYCQDANARKIALSRLQQHGLQREARMLLDNLLKVRRSKPRMARLALEALQVPLRGAMLVTLDVRKKRRVEVPLS